MITVKNSNFIKFKFNISPNRIWATKTSIGMKHASCATCAAFHSLTSNLDQKLIRSTVEIAMIRNLHQGVMDAVKFSVLVSNLSSLGKSLIKNFDGNEWNSISKFPILQISSYIIEKTTKLCQTLLSSFWKLFLVISLTKNRT